MNKRAPIKIAIPHGKYIEHHNLEVWLSDAIDLFEIEYEFSLANGHFSPYFEYVFFVDLDYTKSISYTLNAIYKDGALPKVILLGSETNLRKHHLFASIFGVDAIFVKENLQRKEFVKEVREAINQEQKFANIQF